VLHISAGSGHSWCLVAYVASSQTWIEEHSRSTSTINLPRRSTRIQRASKWQSGSSKGRSIMTGLGIVVFSQMRFARRYISASVRSTAAEATYPTILRSRLPPSIYALELAAAKRKGAPQPLPISRALTPHSLTVRAPF